MFIVGCSSDILIFAMGVHIHLLSPKMWAKHYGVSSWWHFFHSTVCLGYSLQCFDNLLVQWQKEHLPCNENLAPTVVRGSSDALGGPNLISCDLFVFGVWLLFIAILSNFADVRCYGHPLLLHCALAVMQCIVISPACGFVAWLCLFVCGSVTTITQNCMHQSSPNWVCR